MRFRPLNIIIGCVILIGASPVSAQELSGIRYEVVARLDIPHASDATWSPDGTRLAISAWPYIRIWSPDGTPLAITSYPTIQIWDTERWELLRKIPDAPAYSNEWNPTGELIAGAYGGRNENLVIWDAETGEVIRQMVRPPSSYIRGSLVLEDLSWHPDGRQIATDSSLTHNDLLLIWDLETNDNPQPLVTIPRNTWGERWMNVFQLDWSSNGRWLLTSGNDGSTKERSVIRIWDAETGEIIRTIFPGFRAVWGPNDEQFAGLSIVKDAYVINIWDIDTGKVLSSLETNPYGFHISWNFEENVIAGTGYQDNLFVWDVDRGMRYEVEDIKTTYGAFIEWRPNSNQLAIADAEMGILILNFEFDV